MDKHPVLITILGPTASGKTKVAARLCHHINGEVISADSRQVYRRMDIGTGKDYEDYIVNNERIPAHLIDIVEPGVQYNVFEYQKDFLNAYSYIVNQEKIPVLCGGSGMYIDAATKGYKLIHVPVNNELREKMWQKDMDELTEILKSYGPIHNTTDTAKKKRLIRAIEIADYSQSHPEISFDYPTFTPVFFGIYYDRNTRRQRITRRLNQRLNSGMIEEVRQLLNEGLTPDQLIYYGLEYKHITHYLTGDMNYEQMVEKLTIAIHQFAKRQMTWYRGMERKGTNIHWIKGQLPMEKKLDEINKVLENYIGC